MQLSKIKLAIRPRPPLQAIDLGMRLASSYRKKLTLAWLICSLPLFVVLNLLFAWNEPSWVLFFFWLSKPLLDRVPLHVLSLAIFDQEPSLLQTKRAIPSLLKPNWFRDLILRRLSLNRSFNMPVSQLEGLTGSQEKTRLQVLSFKTANAAAKLTSCFSLFESIIIVSIIIVTIQLIGIEYITNKYLIQYMSENIATNLLFFVLNCLYFLVVAFLEPTYVACGFTLYLNQRSILEAWDIELSFKQLAQRLGKVIGCLLLVFSVNLIGSDSVFANTAKADELTSEQPRMLKQMLNTEDAQQKVKEITQAPPFRNITTRRVPKNESENDCIEESSPSVQLPSFVGNITSTVLWVVIALFVLALIWTYRKQLQQAILLKPNLKIAKKQRPQQIMGLDISTESLPEDIIAHTQTLWEKSPRQALSLLYRAFLARLLDVHRLPLKSSSTEQDISQLVPSTNVPLHSFTLLITQQWLNVAWGHHEPDATTFQKLCQTWNDTNRPSALKVQAQVSHE